MARSTHRPGTVSFAAGWAAITGAIWLLRGALAGVGASLLASRSAALGLAGGLLAVLYVVLGFGALLVAGGLYKMTSWARTVALVVFGALTVLNLQLFLSGDVAALVEVGLDGAAFVLLLVERQAFASERPDVDEETSAVDIGS